VISIDPDYFVVFDELASTKAHTYEWICQSIDEPQIQRDGRFIARRGRRVLAGYALLPRQPTMRTEDVTVEPTPWRPEATHRGKRIHISFRRQQKNAQFLTVLALRQEGAPDPQVNLIQGKEAVGAAVQWRGFNDIVLLGDHTDGVSTDAKRCFVRTATSGETTRWAVGDGTRLVYGGRSLLVSTNGVTCAWRVVRGREGAPLRQIGRVESVGTTTLSVFCEYEPEAVETDGKRVNAGYDAAQQLVRLAALRGEHDVVLSFRAP